MNAYEVVAGEPAARNSTHGRITDDAVARLRVRIGIPVRNPAPPHYREPGLDAFRHVAKAYGDENPLWSDRSYVAATRWREPIAPPAMVGGETLIGEDDPERSVMAERPRAATPRYWEDVAAGDEAGALVKGPLTVTDIVCLHVGVGMGLYNIRPLGLGVRNRGRIPRFYHRDELNVPDVMQTTTGTATILLPSREHGPVRLPDPPGHDLDSAMRAITQRFAS